MPEVDTAYLTVDDAARRLRRSSSTVRRWLRSGRLSGRKLTAGGPGGTWRVSEHSCEQAAAQLTAGMDAGMAATVTPQPAIDTITLKALAELTVAVRELTSELRQAQKALPPAREEEQKARPSVLARAWRRLWQRQKGGS